MPKKFRKGKGEITKTCSSLNGGISLCPDGCALRYYVGMVSSSSYFFGLQLQMLRCAWISIRAAIVVEQGR
jgi:hypothetical protein